VRRTSRTPACALLNYYEAGATRQARRASHRWTDHAGAWSCCPGRGCGVAFRPTAPDALPACLYPRKHAI